MTKALRQITDRVHEKKARQEQKRIARQEAMLLQFVKEQLPKKILAAAKKGESRYVVMDLIKERHLVVLSDVDAEFLRWEATRGVDEQSQSVLGFLSGVADEVKTLLKKAKLTPYMGSGT